MQIQAYQPEYATPGTNVPPSARKNTAAPQSARDSQISSSIYAYQSQSVGMVYKNDDGDMVELFFKQERFEAVKSSLPSESMPKVNPFASAFQRIKDFIEQQEQQIMAYFFGENDPAMIHKVMNGANIEVPENTEVNVPEYWSAENTSQRIVEFAMSFYSLSDKSPEAYAEMMKKAVKAGFDQAGSVIGRLPGSVAGLVSETENLAMEKIEKWMQNETRESFLMVA